MQDMLYFGKRIHRTNVDKECKNDLGHGMLCRDIPDVMHTFVTCKGIEEGYTEVIEVIKNFFNVSVKAEEMVTLSFMERNLLKMRLMLWFVIKIMYGIYRKIQRTELYLGILRELEWSQQNNLRIGKVEMIMKMRVELIKILG